jgi:hypothetical protein
MPPPQAKNESPSSEDDDVAATTHRSLPQSSSSPHHRRTTLITIPEAEDEERLDETSATCHEPSTAIAATTVDLQQFVEKENGNNNGYSEASLKVHRKVAEIAADSYQEAAQESHVLSSVMLADLALVNIGELTIGKFLGSGSFSHVQ